MLKRLNELNFVIGLFFTIVSLILLADNFVNKASSGKLNLYTGIAFLIFGVFMIVLKTNKSDH
jgi:putative Ca2+/H+ antiporter (TMEM165/GDT1 family)